MSLISEKQRFVRLSFLLRRHARPSSHAQGMLTQPAMAAIGPSPAPPRARPAPGCRLRLDALDIPHLWPPSHALPCFSSTSIGPVRTVAPDPSHAGPARTSLCWARRPRATLASHARPRRPRRPRTWPLWPWPCRHQPCCWQRSPGPLASRWP